MLQIEETFPGAKEKLVMAGNEVARVSALAYDFVSKTAVVYGKIVYDFGVQVAQAACDAFKYVEILFMC